MERACLPDDQLYPEFAELGFVTVSEALLPLLRLAKKAATVSDITILLEGETGTGKQVLAQAIHRLDQKRGSFPFVTAHCGTINESLAESELFGHEKGAFSGAIAARKGLFQAAHGGTLFLDDVNDLPLNLQPKLLDVLQRGVIRSVGSDKEARVDVRIISACNRPLGPLVEENRMRADLYHRLNVVKLSLLPLRERKSDLSALVLACARRHRQIYPEIRAVAPDLLEYLEGQRFPGNVRELEHAVERALFAKTEGTSLNLSDWNGQNPSEPPGDPDWAGEAADILSRAIFQRGLSYLQAIRDVEARFLEIALRRGDTRREIASRLQTSERTLYHKLRAHRITGRAKALGDTACFMPPRSA
jgi:transcriptional regulator with PAS, ATPase and Fis domain